MKTQITPSGLRQFPTRRILHSECRKNAKQYKECDMPRGDSFFPAFLTTDSISVIKKELREYYGVHNVDSVLTI